MIAVRLTLQVRKVTMARPIPDAEKRCAFQNCSHRVKLIIRRTPAVLDAVLRKRLQRSAVRAVAGRRPRLDLSELIEISCVGTPDVIGPGNAIGEFRT